MTTAELGLITTAAVGISAAAAPTLTAWANRTHERTLARSRRDYEQRRQIYTEVSVYLERQRNLLAWAGRSTVTQATLEQIDEDISGLLGRLAVDGTATVQLRFEDYARARNRMWVALGRALYESESNEAGLDALTEAFDRVQKLTPETVKALEFVQAAMRDELAALP